MTGDGQRDDMANQIVFNVSGHRFITTRETLLKYPDTKLGKLARQSQSSLPKQEYFFDADDDVFREVLRYYRTGYLHLPTSMCYQSFIKQLEFWEIKSNEISDCCFTTDKTEDEMEEEFKVFEQRIEPDIGVEHMSFKYHVWYFLTDPTGPYTRYRKASIVWTLFYLATIVSYALLMALSSVETVIQDNLNVTTMYYIYYTALNDTCGFSHRFMNTIPQSSIGKAAYGFIAFFACEVIIRLIACPRKLYFIKSLNVMDLTISIIESTYVIISASVSDVSDRRICTILSVIAYVALLAMGTRLLRIIKVALLMRRMQVLWLSIWNSKMEVLLLAMILAISCLIGGPMVFYFELYNFLIDDAYSTSLTENSKLSIPNVPVAYWLIMVTMTTVGYGDYSPTSAVGCLIMCMFMMFGLILTALPVAIIGSKFTIYYEYSIKREKKLKRLDKNVSSDTKIITLKETENK